MIFPHPSRIKSLFPLLHSKCFKISDFKRRRENTLGDIEILVKREIPLFEYGQQPRELGLLFSHPGHKM